MQSTEQTTQTVNQEAETQNFQNENIVVSLKKNPGCLVQMDVSVTPKAVEAAYQKAFKEVKKEVSIPGFRKGKAPDDVIAKNYSSYVEKEWKDLCLQTAFNEAVALSGLQPLARSSVKRAELKSCSKEAGAKAVFSYECFPQIPEIDLSQLSTKAQKAEAVNDEAIEWEIKKQRVRHATFEEITDRPVQEGDYVEIDLDITENPAHNVFTNKLFCVTKDDMPKWAYDLVLGMQLNEAREGKAQLDEHEGDCNEVHVHGAHCKHDHEEPKQCRIICTSIKRGILPELNDEFAARFGLKDAEELKTKIREMLQQNADEVAAQDSRSKLAFEILQKYPIDLPRAIVDSEVSARLRFVKKIKEQNQGSLPQGQNDEESLKKLIQDEVYNFFSCMYLLNNVEKDLPISVTESDLTNEIAFETYALQPYQRLVYPGMAPDEARNRMYMRVMMRRKLDLILEKIA